MNEEAMDSFTSVGAASAGETIQDPRTDHQGGNETRTHVKRRCNSSQAMPRFRKHFRQSQKRARFHGACL